MNYSNFIKKIDLPAGFKAPEKLIFEDLIARPLTKDDLENDLAAVNASIEIIRKTRGGSWPAGPVNKEFDVEDLVWHQREFREINSFAYVVYDMSEMYVGCFYLYPMGIRTTLNEGLLDYDIDASWWVSTSAYDKGHYEKLYAALRQWLTTEFPFQQIYYSNTDIPL